MPTTEERLTVLLEELLAEVRALGATKRLPTVLTQRRAAEELDISLPKLRTLIRKGELMTCEVGGEEGVPASEIRRIATGATQRKPTRTPRKRGARRPRSPVERDARTPRVAH